MTKKKVLTREDIEAAADLKTEEVEVEEWGGTIILQEMTAYDRERLRAEMAKLPDDEKNDNMAGRALVRSIVDSDGNRLYTDDEHLLLGKRHPDVVWRLFDRVTIMNKLFAPVEEVEEDKKK